MKTIFWSVNIFPRNLKFNQFFTQINSLVGNRKQFNVDCRCVGRMRDSRRYKYKFKEIDVIREILRMIHK